MVCDEENDAVITAHDVTQTHAQNYFKNFFFSKFENWRREWGVTGRESSAERSEALLPEKTESEAVSESD